MENHWNIPIEINLNFLKLFEYDGILRHNYLTDSFIIIIMIIIFVVHPWAQAAVAVAASQYIISSVCWMDGGWLTEVDLNNHHHQHNII